MNEKVCRRVIIALSLVVVILGAVLIIGGIGSRRKTGKLAADYQSVTDQLESKIGELAKERKERSLIDDRYRDLEGRYNELAGSIPIFIDGLSDLESGLGSVSEEVREVRIGLSDDIEELSGLADEIGSFISSAQDGEDGSVDPGRGDGSPDIPAD